MMIRKCLLLGIVVVGLFSETFAQGLVSSNWYFGNSTQGIKFNRTTGFPELVTDQTPIGIGGSAVATNPVNGDMLFYSDGQNVYDASHNVMANGGGLAGNSASNQPVAIAPVPGQPGQYYIFTNSATSTSGGSLQYSIVDMNLPGNATFPTPNRGAVTDKNQVIDVALANISEAMLLIPKQDEEGFWVITHQIGTSNYAVLEVDAAGNMTVTTIGPLGPALIAAHFAYHPGTGKIAVAPSSNNSNVIILDFDVSTGDLVFNTEVFNSAITNGTGQAIYDVEWSPSGDYLYISRFGGAAGPGDVLRYHVNDPMVTLASVLPATVSESYGLQLGPDGAIYHLFLEGGQIRMGRINQPDGQDDVLYELDPFGVVNFNGRQFPKFSPAEDPNLMVDFTFLGECANNPTFFFPEIIPTADSVQWEFGDADSGTSGSLSPVYTYTEGGFYSVTLRAFLNGLSEEITKQVPITAFDFQIIMPSDTTVCPGDFPIVITAEGQGGGVATYQWSNQPGPGPTTTITEQGYYYVVATVGGCQAYAGINVVEYGSMDQRANVWYFGQNAGIDFNPLPDDPAIPLDNSAMVAPEGSASISNRNGEIIFYTDGNNVYDKDDNLIATGIGGSAGSSQSSIIVPFPGDETLYYIFTTQEIEGGQHEVRYSIFDVKANNGTGAIVEANVLLFARSTERIAAVGNWVIFHEYGNNSFRAYPITADGIGMPVISSIGSVHNSSIVASGQGSMKLSSTGQLALTLSTPEGNFIELFDFDPTSGQVSNFRRINMNQASGQVYGLEFGPGGTKLFATIKGNPTPSFLYEYFLDSLNNPFLKQIIPIPQEAGSLQVGPDGQIYMALNGAGFLHTISVNADTTQLSFLNLQGFQLAPGTSSGLGLPNFIQNISNPPMTPSIFALGFCLGEVTEFFGTGTSDIDEFTWFFGDGNSATGQNTTHTYANPGTYTVTLNITNRCGLNEVLTEQITIFSPPANPTLPAAATLCTDQLVLEATSIANPDLANLTFLWSTGETTRTIMVEQQSIVSVLITNAAGCTSYAETIVVDNRPQVDLGPDITVCLNEPVAALNAGNPGAEYAWIITPGGFTSNTQTLAVDTTVPGVFTYQVTVTNTFNGCVTVTEKEITINPGPEYTLSSDPSPGCGAFEGDITIDITSTGVYGFTIIGTQTIDGGVSQNGPTTLNRLDLFNADTYFVTVRDEISGCAATQTVIVLDEGADFTVVSNDPSTCDAVEVELTLGNLPVGTTEAEYSITNTQDGVVTPSNGPVAIVGGILTTEPIAPGLYEVSVLANGCTAFAEITVTLSDQADVALQKDECVNPVLLSATSTLVDVANIQVSWTGPNGFMGDGPDISVTESGDYIAVLSDNSGFYCPVESTLSVLVEPFEASFDVEGDPCDGSVLLVAQPVGNYAYVWQRNGSVIPGGQVIGVNSANQGTYQVTVRNMNTGCDRVSTPQAITITGPIQVEVTGTQACETQPFTMTAAATPGVGFNWYLNNQLITAAQGRSEWTDTRPGLYRVVINNTAGCTDEDEINIILAPFTPPNLPAREAICNDPENPDPATQQVTLDPGQGYVSYQWFRNNVATGDVSSTLTVSEEGTWRVQVTNNFGCTGSDQTVVANECIPVIVGPNAFRPTSSIMENQQWFLITRFLRDFEIYIFNRWGEMVYSSTDTQFKWNGGYNNNMDKPLPAGNYAYVVKFISVYSPEKGKQEQRGGITLMR